MGVVFWLAGVLTLVFLFSGVKAVYSYSVESEDRWGFFASCSGASCLVLWIVWGGYAYAVIG